jgi:hypothetical protein
LFQQNFSVAEHRDNFSPKENEEKDNLMPSDPNGLKSSEGKTTSHEKSLEKFRKNISEMWR